MVGNDHQHQGPKMSLILQASAPDPDLHFILDSHSHTTEQDVPTSTDHDLTALHATLTTRQETLDQRELGLATTQERIEGMDKRVTELEEETEKCSAQLGGLNVSTSALSSNLWPVTLLRSVVFHEWGDKTSSFLFCSCPTPSSNPSSTPIPNSSTTTTTPSSSTPSSRKTLIGKPNAIDTSSLLALACAPLC